MLKVWDWTSWVPASLDSEGVSTEACEVARCPGWPTGKVEFAVCVPVLSYFSFLFVFVWLSADVLSFVSSALVLLPFRGSSIKVGLRALLRWGLHFCSAPIHAPSAPFFCSSSWLICFCRSRNLFVIFTGGWCWSLHVRFYSLSSRHRDISFVRTVVTYLHSLWAFLEFMSLFCTIRACLNLTGVTHRTSNLSQVQVWEELKLFRRLFVYFIDLSAVFDSVFVRSQLGWAFDFEFRKDFVQMLLGVIDWIPSDG